MSYCFINWIYINHLGQCQFNMSAITNLESFSIIVMSSSSSSITSPSRCSFPTGYCSHATMPNRCYKVFSHYLFVTIFTFNWLAAKHISHHILRVILSHYIRLNKPRFIIGHSRWNHIENSYQCLCLLEPLLWCTFNHFVSSISTIVSKVTPHHPIFKRLKLTPYNVMLVVPTRKH